ncbi:hypothetical protein ES705_26627 [subsurface metagenome]
MVRPLKPARFSFWCVKSDNWFCFMAIVFRKSKVAFFLPVTPHLCSAPTPQKTNGKVEAVGLRLYVRFTTPHPSPWCGVFFSSLYQPLFSFFFPSPPRKGRGIPPLFLLFFPGVFSSQCGFVVSFSPSPLLPPPSLPHAGLLGAASQGSPG